MQAAVAGGHPATGAAGIEMWEAGGTAADAAVAASLAACVAETVMTGLLGGGHAVYFERSTGRVRNLDCFVAVPGLGEEPRHAELIHLDVPFGAELVHYAVGAASCAVPGLPAGLEALSREHGRLPWQQPGGPAARLARDGVDFPPAHAACLAMLAPVMTMNEGAEIYAPHGELLAGGWRLEQPGLAGVLDELASDPRRSTEARSRKSCLHFRRSAADCSLRQTSRRTSRAGRIRWKSPTARGASRRAEVCRACPRRSRVSPICKVSTRPSECWRSSTSSRAPSRWTVTRRTSAWSTATETRASSRRASVSARATSCPAAICT
jgi:Gamma-glutamyltransferase